MVIGVNDIDINPDTHVYFRAIRMQGYGKRLLSFTQSLTSHPISVIDVPIFVYPLNLP